MIGKITLHIAYYHTKTKHKHFITTGGGREKNGYLEDVVKLPFLFGTV